MFFMKITMNTENLGTDTGAETESECGSVKEEQMLHSGSCKYKVPMEEACWND